MPRYCPALKGTTPLPSAGTKVNDLTTGDSSVIDSMVKVLKSRHPFSWLALLA